MPALRELLVSDILIRFCERIPYAFVILWAMDNGGITPQQYGYLVAFEMVTAMLCYIPVAHLADKYGRRPFVLRCKPLRSSMAIPVVAQTRC